MIIPAQRRPTTPHVTMQYKIMGLSGLCRFHCASSRKKLLLLERQEKEEETERECGPENWVWKSCLFASVCLFCRAKEELAKARRRPKKENRKISAQDVVGRTKWNFPVFGKRMKRVSEWEVTLCQNADLSEHRWSSAARCWGLCGRIYRN